MILRFSVDIYTHVYKLNECLQHMIEKSEQRQSNDYFVSKK